MKSNLINMYNFATNEFLQAMQRLGLFVGLYAIIFGLLIGTDWPNWKKQK